MDQVAGYVLSIFVVAFLVVEFTQILRDRLPRCGRCGMQIPPWRGSCRECNR